MDVRVCLQARIGAAEAANKRSEAELIQLRPHATRLQEDLSQSQAKLKTAQADVASLRAEAAHNKVQMQARKFMDLLHIEHCITFSSAVFTLLITAQ